MNRTLIRNDKIEIDIDLERNRIYVHDMELLPKMFGAIMEIPEEAVLFSGSITDFVDFMHRMKKKYGHLYK